MNSYSPRIVVAATALLVLTAAALLAEDVLHEQDRSVKSREFQQLVGGLGFGPATDLSQCPLAFDPRVGVTCRAQHGPIPGGGYFCPQHACSVFSYSPLVGNREPNAKAAHDASSP